VFLRSLLAALDSDSIRYCIVGGLAVNLHGIPRATYDVDLVVVRERAELERLEQVLRRLGLTPRIPVSLSGFSDAAYCEQMRTERNLIAVTFTNAAKPLEEVDVLVSPTLDPNDIVARAIVRESGDLRARVACVDDLIAMKRATGREQDARDVEHLERLRGT